MPKLIFHDSDGIDRTLDLGSDPILIGRAAECQVQTQDALVSRRHARIIWDGNYWIEDLGSSNGVYVAGEKVQKAPIRPGDDVRCGSLILRVVPEVSRQSFAQKPTPSTPPPAPPQSLSPPPPMAPPPMAPPPMAPPPMAPPPMAPPSMAPPPPPPEAMTPRRISGLGGRASTSPPMLPTAEAGPALEEERARRKQAEAAVLTAEQRAASAEAELGEAKNRVAALEQRLADAEAQAQEAAERAAHNEESAHDSEKWHRKAEQLTAELRRLRGGQPPEEVTNTDAHPNPILLADLTSERDKLRARVSELEAEAASRPAQQAQAAGPGTDADQAMLRRKVEQLTAENRRLRGGQPAPSPGNDERVEALEQKLAATERERDEARRLAETRAAAVEAPSANPSEVDKLKRMIDQLSAENRRLRQGAGPSPAPPSLGVPVEDPRIAELGAKLALAEKELGALKAAPRPAPKAGASTGLPPGLVDAVGAIDDALADLRGSLRAAQDEVGVLGVEAPSDSVTVLKDALAAASEQMDTARGKIREARTLVK